MPKIIGAADPSRSPAPLRILWRNVVVEQALGITILGIVSVLGTLPPGSEVGQASRWIDHAPVVGSSQRYLLTVSARLRHVSGRDGRWNDDAFASKESQS